MSVFSEIDAMMNETKGATKAKARKVTLVDLYDRMDAYRGLMLSLGVDAYSWGLIGNHEVEGSQWAIVDLTFYGQVKATILLLGDTKREAFSRLSSALDSATLVRKANLREELGIALLDDALTHG